MDAPHPHGDPPPDQEHPHHADGPLTFRLGKPINGHTLNGRPVRQHPPAHQPDPPESPAQPSDSSDSTEPPASTGPNDPRWVLAIRAREALRGNALPDDQQRKLIRLGSLLGLTESQVRHIVEGVENQARRGLEPSALDLLGHMPEAAATPTTGRHRIVAHAAFWSLLVLVAELLIVLAVL